MFMPKSGIINWTNHKTMHRRTNNPFGNGFNFCVSKNHLGVSYNEDPRASLSLRRADLLVTGDCLEVRI